MVRRMRHLAVFAAAWVALGSLVERPLTAHHSPVGTYRTGEQTTIDGVLVSILYRRPHSYLYLEDRTPDQKKQMRVWAVESGEGSWLKARVDEGSLRPGDRIVVTGEPARDDGARRLRLRRLVRPSDGWGWAEGGR
jgi:hypothetical protein